MAIFGGGFTFLPRSLTCRQHANLIVNALFTERKNVLLKLQQFGGHKESYTLITPLHDYKHYNFGIQVNSYTGYTPPVYRFMYDYILLGIIPKHVAAQRNIQGFTSNGRPVQFKNCDANPNSLYPNHTLFSSDSSLDIKIHASNQKKLKVPITPKYFFRLNKSLHLFETNCTFLN